MKKTPIGHTGLPGKNLAWSNANIMVNTVGPPNEIIDLSSRLKNRLMRFTMVNAPASQSEF